MAQTTRQAELNKLKTSLLSIYDQREALSIAEALLEGLFSWQKLDYMLYGYVLIEVDEQKIEGAKAQLLEGKPLQYVLGKAHFYDLEFKLKGATLIPRPETEELVHWIIKENKSGKILDIGTGSGAIAIALARAGFACEGIDISPEALIEAKENAKANNTEVNFMQVDVLGSDTDTLISDSYDVIVSNPPYIPMSEKASMHRNVVDFEPHLGLFVPDDDPLLFYRRIAQLSLRLLKNDGWLYFEIHENFATETMDLLRSLGYENLELRQDINSKNRMIKCQNKRPQSKH